jgi:predicted membrane protein
MDESSTRFHASVNVGTSQGPSIGRIIAGSAIVIVGIGLLLDEFGHFEFGQVVSTWWPLIIVLAGVVRLIQSPSKWVGSVVLIVWGSLVQLNIFDYLPGGFWGAFWPVALIIAGLSILFNAKKKAGRNANQVIGAEHRGSSDENVLHRSVTFGEDTIYSRATAFRGGTLSVTLGEMTVDLRSATASGSMALDVSVSLGQLNLRVPQHWRVEVIGSPTLGEIKNSALHVPPSDGTVAPVLSVRASATLGAIEITT